MDEISSKFTRAPESVVRAAALIVISMILGVVSFWIDYDLLVQPGEEGFAITVFSIMIGSVLLFAYLALKGRNWARVVFLCLVLIGLLPAIVGVGEELQRNIFLGFVSLAQAFCQVAAIILFFLPTSNEWYREIKAARQS